MRTLEETAAGVRDGSLDPVELVEVALARAADAAELNAVVHLDVEGARKAAAAHDRGGALAGVPVLVKEIVEVEGLPYRCGSASMDEVGRKDAEVVRRLRAAGAIIIGLSHTHEYAYGCTGTSNRVGPCRNPHDSSRMTGGSSSGSAAAVAAGVVLLAIGTDTAGSVRIPAALCGVVGFKPSYNTIPADRVFPLSQSLDHVGVLTRTAADAAYALTALGGLRAFDLLEPRLGVATNPEYLRLTAEARPAWSAALETFDALDVQLPEWSHSFTTAANLQGPEAVANHLGRSHDRYQPDVQQRLREASAVQPADYTRAQEDAIAITRQLDAVLQQVDAVLTPTVLTTAPLITEAATPDGGLEVRKQLLNNTRLANLTRHAAVSIPLPTDGLPVGLQIIAASNEKAAAVACRLSDRFGYQPDSTS
ncbi:aspartyl-tRNA(Asn)/glutamyl-tRNA(Gln) amidotransferase subunit A [Kribbella rubisoli]|uniref:Aspartyl-tRNA(Asn)/glutamyl-tRNA(Gln) amidotransferase subunit A n=1 Tax=Kribbella rubisoli TaxID=3075929 RepID=A0A4Q7XBQ1_9ACTN|nr:amidase [Kribbella rubisoli]RZU20554.1 aspartyl-tRNA(Asn)/glutamyl-tRNA(Gln) amidotransferase subunit A [Kribbella rubisoli]